MHQMEGRCGKACARQADTGFPTRPSFKGTAIMDRKKTSNHHGRLNRRSFLDAAGRLAGGGLAVGATFETIRPSSAWGQQSAKETHPSSARVVDRLKTHLSFQISVDVGTPASP